MPVLAAARIRPLVLALMLSSMVADLAMAQVGGIGRRLRQRAEEVLDRIPDSTRAADPARPGIREIATNFDFIPGQRTLFYTDFTDEQVGNFPRRLEFTSGSMEVVQLDGMRALKATDPSGFVIPLPEALPAKFTLEVDVINRNSLSTAAPTLRIHGGTAARTDADTDRTRVAYGHVGWDVKGGGTTAEGNFTSEDAARFMGQAVSVRVLADGAYLKVYADGRRLANVPNANFMRGRGLYLALEGRDAGTGAVYVTRIRVAESLKTIYEALLEEGRWATQGIYFETGKSVVRSESVPTLREIAGMLAQHADLHITIEGHTDNTGNDALNLQLSQARAAAVRDALIRDFSIDPARLEAVGLGATRPVAENGTAEGRASNRRVEIVKR